MSQEQQIRSLEERIEALTDRFQLIHIEQGAILQDIKNTQTKLLRLVRKHNRQTRQAKAATEAVDDSESEEELFYDPQEFPTLVSREEERPYTTRFVPKIGDNVRITNSRPGQRDRGKIVGFCRNGKAKVGVGDNLPKVQRSSKNIVNVKQFVSSSNYKHERKPARFILRH